MRQRKPKTTKPKGKPNRAFKKEAEDMRTTATKEGRGTKEDNDISWWSKNPQLLRDAASLPFSQSLGTAYVVPGNRLVERKDDRAFPGLMTFNFVPCIGLEADYRSAPINLAAQNIYSEMRSHNSGATNYDAPNLMQYFLVMDGVYGFYSYLTRIYGAMRVYSHKNRYLPRLLVEANGCDYDDLVSNMAQLRYFINQFAIRASSLCVPATMPYFTRHFWLTQNVFLDEETSKSQMYMFVPACFLKYAGILNTNQPSITMVYPLRDDTKRTLADLISIGNDLLDAVMADQDINTMSGDMLKTYGEGALFRLQPIPEEYTIIPVYSEEVSLQIHNATVLGIPSPEYGTATDWNKNIGPGNRFTERLQNSSNPTSYLYGQEQFWEYFAGTAQATSYSRGGKYYPLTVDQLLNSHYEENSAADVMEMTRLKICARPYLIDTSPRTFGAVMHAAGTEYIANARVYYAELTTDAQNLTTVRYVWEEFSTVMTKAEFAAAARFLIFRNHPIVTLLDKAVTKIDETVEVVGFVGDIDNYTFVAPETLKRIHEAALLSAFDVPLLGSF